MSPFPDLLRIEADIESRHGTAPQPTDRRQASPTSRQTSRNISRHRSVHAEQATGPSAPQCLQHWRPGSGDVTIDIAWASIPHHICGPPGVLVEHGDHLQPGYKGLRLSQLILSYIETGLVVEMVRALGWQFHQNPGYPGPMVNFFFEVHAVGRQLLGSQAGHVRVNSIEEFPPISPNRGGSQAAFAAFKMFYDL